MVNILPVASGKGGVGKSLFVANLGVCLAKLGKTAIIVDLDLGGANLHTCMGIKNTHAGIGALIYRQETKLESLVVETEVPRLFFIAGDSLLPGTANIEFFMKKKIIRELGNLVADFIIIDLGAGSSYNVVDFFLMSMSGIIVVQPEITSVLNAYSFLKTSMYRMLYRSFPKGSDERKVITEFLSTHIEGGSNSILRFAEGLAQSFPDTAGPALAQLKSLFPRVVVNMGRSERDINVGQRLREIVARNLGIGMEYIGFLPEDSSVTKSLHARTPVTLARPEAPYSKTIMQIAARIADSPNPYIPKLYTDNEDLVSMMDEGLKEGIDLSI